MANITFTLQKTLPSGYTNIYSPNSVTRTFSNTEDVTFFVFHMNECNITSITSIDASITASLESGSGSSSTSWFWSSINPNAGTDFTTSNSTIGTTNGTRDMG